MIINHENLLSAGFENTHHGTMWMYKKGRVHVGILREKGIEGEIIIHVGNEKQENISKMNELKALNA